MSKFKCTNCKYNFKEGTKIVEALNNPCPNCKKTNSVVIKILKPNEPNS